MTGPIDKKITVENISPIAASAEKKAVEHKGAGQRRFVDTDIPSGIMVSRVSAEKSNIKKLYDQGMLIYKNLEEIKGAKEELGKKGADLSKLLANLTVAYTTGDPIAIFNAILGMVEVAKESKVVFEKLQDKGLLPTAEQSKEYLANSFTKNRVIRDPKAYSREELSKPDLVKIIAERTAKKDMVTVKAKNKLMASVRSGVGMAQRMTYGDPVKPLRDKFKGNDFAISDLHLLEVPERMHAKAVIDLKANAAKYEQELAQIGVTKHDIPAGSKVYHMESGDMFITAGQNVFFFEFLKEEEGQALFKHAFKVKTPENTEYVPETKNTYLEGINELDEEGVTAKEEKLLELLGQKTAALNENMQVLDELLDNRKALNDKITSLTDAEKKTQAGKALPQFYEAIEAEIKICELERAALMKEINHIGNAGQALSLHKQVLVVQDRTALLELTDRLFKLKNEPRTEEWNKEYEAINQRLDILLRNEQIQGADKDILEAMNKIMQLLPENVQVPAGPKAQEVEASISDLEARLSDLREKRTLAPALKAD